MRRRWLLAAGGAAGVAGGGVALAMARGRAAWQEAVAEQRRPAEIALTGMAARRELVRLATLAASSHNTQPWRFVAEEERIVVVPDMARRCPAVDPDDHHLFASLGAAAENVVQAAPAFGLEAAVRFLAGGDGAVEIRLTRAGEREAPLLAAIVQRQCTRAPYEPRPVASTDQAALEAAGSLEGVRVALHTGREALAAVAGYVVAGNAAQMADSAFMAELVAWLRFDHAEAVARKDGLFAAGAGNPVLPGWIARPLLPLVFTEAAETAKYRVQVAASAGVAVFAAPLDAPEGWVAAGRACQRFALRATAVGVRHAFLNQPVEVKALRARFAGEMGLGERRPNLVVRYGHGGTLPMSLRRPVSDVLAGA
jgi:nitroreductase